MTQASSPSPSANAQAGAPVTAPMTGTLVSWLVRPGEAFHAGQPVLILEAMKMEHEIHAPGDGVLGHAFFNEGETVEEGEQLFGWTQTLRPAARVTAPAPAAMPASAAAPTPAPTPAATANQPAPADTTPVRADLQQLRARTALTLDAARPAAMAKRHEKGLRMARENIADLCDDGSFIEYGALAVAAQRTRRSLDDLIANTPADGMITGVGTINSAEYGEARTSCAVMSYDYTVLAGTQGTMNHKKTDRLLDVALNNRLPMILFAEGGGGRPGDVDKVNLHVSGLHLTTFAKFAALSGEAPLMGIVAGRCFAGNAALLGCCDVIIATRDSNIGMGGPAMIEGGGLGRFEPEVIGPSDIQSKNGVIDCLVENEAEAVAVAKKYLGFTQGTSSQWQAPPALGLRDAIPENRLRSYDVRKLILGLIDVGSGLELRPAFGIGIQTWFGRIEGHPVGIMANNPMHLGGAIDADAGDKAARFMQLCESYALPIVSLIDTPGFMVGPEIEKKAQVRHVSRMFVTAAKLSVPFVALVLRKGYGLGAMAMAAGGFHSPLFTASWPTGEFGGMGLEGAVKLGFKKELDAQPEGPLREALYQKLLAEFYERGKATNVAAMLEIDSVIDPADSRDWLRRGIRAGLQQRAANTGRSSRRFIDTW